MNTTSTRAWRDKYRMKALDKALRNALVCEKICKVDRSDNYRIQNPYLTQPTAAAAALAGTYSVSAWTITDEALTVGDQASYGVHIFEFESTMNNFNLFADLVDDMSYAVAKVVDSFVLNDLTESAGGSYTTPAGGFTTMSNINVIMSNLISKVEGYAQAYSELYLVIENTDVVGFIQAQAANGFSYADRTLNNGFMTSYMGVDIYVVRSGTFVDDTIGTITVTNSGHRVFGVKGASTYAQPRGIQIIEKEVTLKTGKELAVVANYGHKLWTTNANLVVDITLA